MYLENIEKDAIEFTKRIKDAKILHLTDSEVVRLLNSSIIPVFSKGATLDRISEKVLQDGSKYEAVRPYFVCYNKTLGCRVIYPMTASQTEETIREHKRYHFVEVPEEVYCFIESAVPGNRFHQETHSEDSMSTINVERGMPIFAECLDFEDLCIVHDYDNFSFSSRLLPKAQGFIDDIYGRHSNATTKLVTNASDNIYTLVKGKNNEYDHQHYRPAVVYLAMFLNWSENAVTNNWFSDVAEIERVRSLREITLKTYVEYLRHSKVLRQFQSQYPKAYHEYSEIKTFAPRRKDGTIGNAYIQECMEKNPLIEEGSIESLNDLMKLEEMVQRDMAFVSKAISMFIADSKRTIDMSLTQVDVKFFTNLKAMAHNQYDPNGIQRLNTAFAGICESKILQIEERKAKARQEKEAELERRSQESKRRQEANLSKAQRLAENVEEAIKIYITHYNDVLSDCEEASLFRPEYIQTSKEFIKLYTSYDPKYSDLREYIEDSDTTPVQARFSSAILNLSKFIDNVNDAVEIIEEKTRARALQDYISGRTKVVEGEQDRQTLNALELIKLVHAEFTRAFKLCGSRKLTRAQMQEVVNKIMEKATRNKDKFSDLDIGKYSRARTMYLDDVVAVRDSEYYIFELCAICKLHQEALKYAKEIRLAYISLQMTRNAVGGYFEGVFEDTKKFVVGDVDGLEAIITQKEKELEQILKDRNLNILETSKRMREFAGSECELCAREQNDLLKVSQRLDNIRRRMAEYNKYYNEIIEEVPNFVRNEKEQRGIDESFGVFDSHDLPVIIQTKDFDVVDEQTVNEQVESKMLTDCDLIEFLFTRGLISPGVYSKLLVDKIKSAKSVKELITNLIAVDTKCESSCDDLMSDYTYILKTYGQMLDAINVIKMHSSVASNARAGYIENFNPTWDKKVNGKPVSMFPQDVIEGLKEVFRLVNQDRQSVEEELDKRFLDHSATGILDFIQGLEQRTNLDEKVEQRFSFESITKGSERVKGLEYIVNIKGFKMDAEEEARVISSLSPNKVLFEYLGNEHILRSMSCLTMPLFLEIQHEFLKTGIEEGILNDAYDGDYRRAMAKAMELNAYIKKAFEHLRAYGGVECYDCVYDYLVNALKRVKHLAEHGKIKVLAPDRLGLGNTSVSQYYDMYYIEWVERIHKIEEDRRAEGRYIITEGRDFEDEEETLSSPSGVNTEVLERFSGESIANITGTSPLIDVYPRVPKMMDPTSGGSTRSKPSPAEVESLKTGDPRIDEVLDEMLAEGFEFNEQFIEAFKDATAIIGMLGGGDGSNIADASKFLDSISLKNILKKGESGEDD